MNKLCLSIFYSVLLFLINYSVKCQYCKLKDTLLISKFINNNHAVRPVDQKSYNGVLYTLFNQLSSPNSIHLVALNEADGKIIWSKEFNHSGSTAIIWTKALVVKDKAIVCAYGINGKNNDTLVLSKFSLTGELKQVIKVFPEVVIGKINSIDLNFEDNELLLTVGSLINNLKEQIWCISFSKNDILAINWNILIENDHNNQYRIIDLKGFKLFKSKNESSKYLLFGAGGPTDIWSNQIANNFNHAIGVTFQIINGIPQLTGSQYYVAAKKDEYSFALGDCYGNFLNFNIASELGIEQLNSGNFTISLYGRYSMDGSGARIHKLEINEKLDIVQSKIIEPGSDVDCNYIVSSNKNGNFNIATYHETSSGGHLNINTFTNSGELIAVAQLQNPVEATFFQGVFLPPTVEGKFLGLTRSAKDFHGPSTFSFFNLPLKQYSGAECGLKPGDKIKIRESSAYTNTFIISKVSVLNIITEQFAFTSIANSAYKQEIFCSKEISCQLPELVLPDTVCKGNSFEIKFSNKIQCRSSLIFESENQDREVISILDAYSTQNDSVILIRVNKPGVYNFYLRYKDCQTEHPIYRVFVKDNLLEYLPKLIDTIICNNNPIKYSIPLWISNLKLNDLEINNEFILSDTGQYIITGSTECFLWSDTFNIRNDLSTFSANPNQLNICRNDKKLIEIKENQDMPFLIKSITPNNAIEIAGQNTFFLQGSIDAELVIVEINSISGCTHILKFPINLYNPPTPPKLGPVYYKCEWDTVTLKLDESWEYKAEWSDGQSGNNANFFYPGSYSIRITDSNNCAATTNFAVTNSECSQNFYVPNSFTPNGDGLNDYFEPLFQNTPSYFHFTIFNRWGQKIYETDKIGLKWNGKSNGKMVPSGSYIWKLRFAFPNTPIVIRNGSFQLIK